MRNRRRLKIGALPHRAAGSILALAVIGICRAAPGDEPASEIARRFTENVRPVLENQCYACHGSEKQEAKLDLSRFDSAQAVAESPQLWQLVRQRLEAGEMPPEDDQTNLPDQQRRAVVTWIAEAQQFEAEQNAGDPGRVLARRLSNAEFDYTIRDLTSVDIREHMRLMCDIVALAFQTDKTRVATLLLCRDLSGLFYPFLDVRTAHHPTSHKDESDEYERVTRFYVGQFAYLASRLAAMPEGGTSVLDNSCLMFLSNMWSGSRHDSSKLPIVLAGGLGGAIATGRVLNYQDRGEENRRLCSLYLSLLPRMDAPTDRFGDATTPLADL